MATNSVETTEKKIVNNRVVTFSTSKTKQIPKDTEKVNIAKGWIEWGEKNDFPLFYVDLFDGSAWNQGLIKSKSYYIAGGGIEDAQGRDISSFITNKGSDYTIEEIEELKALDLEMFGGYAIVGTWDRFGKKVAFWEHIDFESVRQDVGGKIYHVSEDWTQSRQSEKTGYFTINALDMNNREGRFLLYYKEPSKKSRGSKGTYPKPSYYGGLKAIQTDSDISAYHLNEINQGFSAGTGLNFANGVPETEEEATEETKRIKKKLTGVENAGEVFITFSDGSDNAPTVLRLTGDDLDKRYNLTEKSVQQNILVAHSTTTPLLHGIKQEGLSIGSGTEMQVGYEIFKNTYVLTKQKRLKFGLDIMSELSGYDFDLILIPAPLILDEKLFTASSQNVEINIGGEKKKSNDQVEKTDEEVLLDLFSKIGVDRSEIETFVRKAVPADVTNADVIELEKTNFKLLFDIVGDISIALTDFDKVVLNLIDEGNDAQHIARAIDAKLEEVIGSIQKLKSLNLFDSEVTDLGKQVLQDIPVDISTFQILYSYELRPELIDEIIPGTRDFCRTLITLNKLYTRTEIETISNAVDRDVWKYRGGWWNDGGTNKPFCRHIWFQNLVKI